MEIEEKFIEIQGTEGRYFVSSMGRVRSLVTGIILKPFNRKEYLSVDFKVHGVVKYLTVHKLVATAFLGPCPEGMQVNHKDMNKHNNCASNLEYITPVENIRHAWKNGTFDRKGVRCPSHKLTDSDVISIRDRFNKGASTRKLLAEQFGVSRSNIDYIVKGKSWTHLSTEASCQVN
jgi:hypothetical protein